MNKESTLYDYTKSAEELRVFELGETCSKIIHEYEMFNLQNDVYKMFGEWLLEQAKTGYSATFTEKILLDFLKSKRLSNPKSKIIRASEDDYDQCEKLRELCRSDYIDSLGGYRSNYSWYTIWKISRTYNCRNGCIVVDAPSYLTVSGSVAIVLDWSKEAQDCISREKWRSDAKKETPFGLCALFGGIVGAMLGFLLVAVLAIINISTDIIFLAYLGFIAFCTVVIGALSRPTFVDLEIDKLSKNFITHCKRIDDTRYSRYSVISDSQRNFHGYF